MYVIGDRKDVYRGLPEKVYFLRMLEGDDNDLRRKLDRAKRDPSVSPNVKYQLEAQVKKNEKQKLAKLHREMARKELNSKQNKLKAEMNKKGIQNVATKPDAKQEIEKAKRQEDIKKEQDRTENPAQAV